MALRVLNQRYTPRELWALRRSIARALANPRRLVNGGRVALSLALRREEPSGDPLLLLVEPSSRCNLSCGFCPITDQPPKQAGELDPALYRTLLDELGDSLLFLCLWFYGEPLLHPQLEDFVAQARRRGVMVAVSTNAVALEPERAQALLAADLDWLYVSLDGATAATHDAHRGEGSFEAATRNVAGFVRRREALGQSKPLVELKPILHRGNEHEREAMLALGRSLGVDRLTFQLLTWTHDPDLRQQAPTDPALVLDYPSPGPKPHTCGRSISSAVVGWDGALLPCCEDHGRSQPLGSLAHGESFRDAWRGEAWRRLRRSQRDPAAVTPLCRRCHIGDFEAVNLSVPLKAALPRLGPVSLSGLARGLRRARG